MLMFAETLLDDVINVDERASLRQQIALAAVVLKRTHGHPSNDRHGVCWIADHWPSCAKYWPIVCANQTGALKRLLAFSRPETQ